VPIGAKFVSSIPSRGEVCLIFLPVICGYTALMHK